MPERSEVEAWWIGLHVNRFQVIHKAGVVPVTIKKTFMLHTNHKRDPCRVELVGVVQPLILLNLPL
jgi:hypothetical protein